jgi:hypothetical protein
VAVAVPGRGTSTSDKFEDFPKDFPQAIACPEVQWVYVVPFSIARLRTATLFAERQPKFAVSEHSSASSTVKLSGEA